MNNINADHNDKLFTMNIMDEFSPGGKYHNLIEKNRMPGEVQHPDASSRRHIKKKINDFYNDIENDIILDDDYYRDLCIKIKIEDKDEFKEFLESKYYKFKFNILTNIFENSYENIRSEVDKAKYDDENHPAFKDIELMMNIPPYSNGASGGNDSLYTGKMASGITKTGKLFTDVDSIFNSNEEESFIEYIKTILGDPGVGPFKDYNILKTKPGEKGFWDFNPQQFGAGKSGAYIIRINVLHTKIFWSSLIKLFDGVDIEKHKIWAEAQLKYLRNEGPKREPVQADGILDKKIIHYLKKIKEHNSTKPTNYILKFYPTSFLYNIKNKEDKIREFEKEYRRLKIEEHSNFDNVNKCPTDFPDKIVEKELQSKLLLRAKRANKISEKMSETKDDAYNLFSNLFYNKNEGNEDEGNEDEGNEDEGKENKSTGSLWDLLGSTDNEDICKDTFRDERPFREVTTLLTLSSEEGFPNIYDYGIITRPKSLLNPESYTKITRNKLQGSLDNEFMDNEYSKYSLFVVMNMSKGAQLTEVEPSEFNPIKIKKLAEGLINFIKVLKKRLGPNTIHFDFHTDNIFIDTESMNLSIIDFDLMDGEIFRSGDRLGYFDLCLKEHIDKLYSKSQVPERTLSFLIKYIGFEKLAELLSNEFKKNENGYSILNSDVRGWWLILSAIIINYKYSVTKNVDHRFNGLYMINNNFLDEIKQIMNIESDNNEELDGILTGKDNQEVKDCYDIIRLLDYFTNENYCNNTKESIVRKYMDDCIENDEPNISKYICKIVFNVIIFAVLRVTWTRYDLKNNIENYPGFNYDISVNIDSLIHILNYLPETIQCTIDQSMGMEKSELAKKYSDDLLDSTKNIAKDYEEKKRADAMNIFESGERARNMYQIHNLHKNSIRGWFEENTGLGAELKETRINVYLDKLNEEQLKYILTDNKIDFDETMNKGQLIILISSKLTQDDMEESMRKYDISKAEEIAKTSVFKETDDQKNSRLEETARIHKVNIEKLYETVNDICGVKISWFQAKPAPGGNPLFISIDAAIRYDRRVHDEYKASAQAMRNRIGIFAKGAEVDNEFIKSLFPDDTDVDIVQKLLEATGGTFRSTRNSGEIRLDNAIYQFKKHINDGGMCKGNICIRILSKLLEKPIIVYKIDGTNVLYIPDGRELNNEDSLVYICSSESYNLPIILGNISSAAFGDDSVILDHYIYALPNDPSNVKKARETPSGDFHTPRGDRTPSKGGSDLGLEPAEGQVELAEEPVEPAEEPVEGHDDYETPLPHPNKTDILFNTLDDTIINLGFEIKYVDIYGDKGICITRLDSEYSKIKDVNKGECTSPNSVFRNDLINFERKTMVDQAPDLIERLNNFKDILKNILGIASHYNNIDNIRNNVPAPLKNPIHYDPSNENTILKLDDYKKINVEYDKREDEPPVEDHDMGLLKKTIKQKTNKKRKPSKKRMTTKKRKTSKKRKTTKKRNKSKKQNTYKKQKTSKKQKTTKKQKTSKKRKTTKKRNRNIKGGNRPSWEPTYKSYNKFTNYQHAYNIVTDYFEIECQYIDIYLGINQMLPDRLDINFYEYNNPVNKLLFKLNEGIYQKLIDYATKAKAGMISIAALLNFLSGPWVGPIGAILLGLGTSGSLVGLNVKIETHKYMRILKLLVNGIYIKNISLAAGEYPKVVIKFFYSSNIEMLFDLINELAGNLFYYYNYEINGDEINLEIKLYDNENECSISGLFNKIGCHIREDKDKGDKQYDIYKDFMSAKIGIDKDCNTYNYRMILFGLIGKIILDKFINYEKKHKLHFNKLKLIPKEKYENLVAKNYDNYDDCFNEISKMAYNFNILLIRWGLIKSDAEPSDLINSILKVLSFKIINYLTGTTKELKLSDTFDKLESIIKKHTDRMLSELSYITDVKHDTKEEEFINEMKQIHKDTGDLIKPGKHINTVLGLGFKNSKLYPPVDSDAKRYAESAKENIRNAVEAEEAAARFEAEEAAARAEAEEAVALAEAEEAAARAEAEEAAAAAAEEVARAEAEEAELDEKLQRLQESLARAKEDLTRAVTEEEKDVLLNRIHTILPSEISDTKQKLWDLQGHLGRGGGAGVAAQ